LPSKDIKGGLKPSNPIKPQAQGLTVLLQSPFASITMSSEQTVYRLAVCLYPDVTILDYQGPIEILGGFSTELQARFGHFYKIRPSCAINVVFLSHTKEPVKPLTGPGLVPTMTYKEAMETDIDIILIPGGVSALSKNLVHS
jgi:hypothetical protein